jgi:hypothetical protein
MRTVKQRHQTKPVEIMSQASSIHFGTTGDRAQTKPRQSTLVDRENAGSKERESQRRQGQPDSLFEPPDAQAQYRLMPMSRP